MKRPPERNLEEEMVAVKLKAERKSQKKREIPGFVPFLFMTKKTSRLVYYHIVS